jgi:polyphosphate kinase
MPTSRKPKSASDKSKSTPSKSATRRKPASKRTNTSRKPAKAARKTRSGRGATETYINRELSLLEFNRRVLEQAKDETVPLLMRLFFLTICSSNLDEFFEVRAAGLKQQVAFGLDRRKFDGLTPHEALARVSETAHGLVEEQYRVLNDTMLPALETEGIRVVRRHDWTPRVRTWAKRLFDDDVMPVLTPIGLDPAHPFPRVLNKSLNFIVSVEGKDAFGREIGLAVVQVPRALPRIIGIPISAGGRKHDFVLLSSLIHAHVGELFPGMKVTGCYQFRVTRNSNLWVDEEEVENLLQALKGELPRRRYGAAVRLEVADNCPDEAAEYLLEQVELDPEDLYRVHGPVNLHRLVALVGAVDRSDLKFPSFVPGLPRRLRGERDIFDTLRRGDILLHHPFESFGPVLDLLRTAASDPNVLAIKQTLYRTEEGSPLVDALIDAARAGKQVTALVELRARFDEAANIDLATQLEEVGANVVYGIVGYKTHAKMLMIVRREGKRLRRYVHLGTGNYHTGTVRAYTDLGLLTANKEMGEDVHRVFLELTGLGKASKLSKILQAPFTLRKSLFRMIRAEARAAAEGKPARIVAKMNSLSERGIIDELYAASQAGVQIDLIVRGVCCLRAGVKGLSENIRVRSIVGRFLEHTRIFWFHAGGKELVYCASADWMSRNLLRRVETCFPVEDARLKQKVIDEGLQPYLTDNAQAWELQPDGSYARAAAGKEPRSAAQEWLLDRLTG